MSVCLPMKALLKEPWPAIAAQLYWSNFLAVAAIFEAAEQFQVDRKEGRKELLRNPKTPKA